MVELSGRPRVKIDVGRLTDKPGQLLGQCIVSGTRMCWPQINLIIDVNEYATDQPRWSPPQLFPLKSISGVHPRQTELALETDSPLSETLYPNVSLGAVLEYLVGSPILLMPLRGRLYCVREVQTYMWLCRTDDSPDDIYVPVRIYESSIQNRVYDDTLINNMLVPSLIQRAESLDMASIYRIWRKWLKISKKDRARDTLKGAESRAGFARAVHVDKRILK